LATKKKYYVVWQGNQPGIYNSWTECQLQIKGYPDAKYKSFPSLEEAEKAFYSDYSDAINKGEKNKKEISPDQKNIIWESIAVDGASSGNPGVMEYQGVDTKTKEQLFHQKFELGTNNIGEFLALVHALAMLEKQQRQIPIYSDSKIAIGWIKKKKCNTKLERNRKTEVLFQVIARAEKWLETNPFRVPILKWETGKWGEIPADFGRK
jgi:ribonuclease HI